VVIVLILASGAAWESSVLGLLAPALLLGTAATRRRFGR